MPRFLSLSEILEIHLDQIRRYGGDPGLRDPGLLQSAVEMPRMMFDGRYLHPTLAGMAAAYLFHLVSNHPFVDGNKRVGTVAFLVFLRMNGMTPRIDHASLEATVMALARGDLTKARVTAWVEQLCAA